MACSISGVGGGKAELLSMNQSSLSGNRGTFTLTSAQGDQLEADAEKVTFLYFYVKNNFSGSEGAHWENFGAIALASAFCDFVQTQKAGQIAYVAESLISSLDLQNSNRQIAIERNKTTGVITITAQGWNWSGYNSSGMTLKIYGIK